MSLDGGEAASAWVTAPNSTTTISTSVRAALRTTAQPYLERGGAARRIHAERPLSLSARVSVTRRRGQFGGGGDDLGDQRCHIGLGAAGVQDAGAQGLVSVVDRPGHERLATRLDGLG